MAKQITENKSKILNNNEGVKLLEDNQAPTIKSIYYYL